ncbi:MAG: MbtH family protein [Pseudonocardiaceae bacterium]
MTNYFENLDGICLALTDDESRHSPWPAFIDVPTGWPISYPPSTRDVCLGYVDQYWIHL